MQMYLYIVCGALFPRIKIALWFCVKGIKVRISFPELIVLSFEIIVPRAKKTL